MDLIADCTFQERKQQKNLIAITFYYLGLFTVVSQELKWLLHLTKPHILFYSRKSFRGIDNWFVILSTRSTLKENTKSAQRFWVAQNLKLNLIEMWCHSLITIRSEFKQNSKEKLAITLLQWCKRIPFTFNSEVSQKLTSVFPTYENLLRILSLCQHFIYYQDTWQVAKCIS